MDNNELKLTAEPNDEPASEAQGNAAELAMDVTLSTIPTQPTAQSTGTMLPHLRKLFSAYRDLSDEEILNRVRKKYNAYYDIPDDKLAAALDNKFKVLYDEVSEDVEEAEGESDRPLKWYHKPIVDLPRWLGLVDPREADEEYIDEIFTAPAAGWISGADQRLPIHSNAKRALYGGIYGALESLSELTTPLNLGLLTMTAGIGPIVKRGYHVARFVGSLSSLIFAAQMGKQLPKGYEQFGKLVQEAKEDPAKWAEVGRLGVHLLLGTGMAATIARHGVREAVGEVRTMKHLASLGEKPTAKMTPAEIAELTQQKIAEQAEKEQAQLAEVAAGKKFNYEEINELQQRAKGLMELTRAKAELEKMTGKPKVPSEQPKSEQLELFDEYIRDERGIGEHKALQEKVAEPVVEDVSTTAVELDKLSQAALPTIKEVIAKDAKLSKNNMKYCNQILREAGKRGMIDSDGKASFEFLRLLDMFNAERLDLMNGRQLRQLRNIISRMPKDYPLIVRRLSEYYDKVNELIFSPDIARQLVSNKDLVDIRVPYDKDHDYVFNRLSHTFEKEKISIADEELYRNVVAKAMKLTKSAADANEVLLKITGGHVKRMAVEDLAILDKRLSTADPGYTKDELIEYLSTGQPVSSFSEQFVAGRFEWLKSKYFQSAYTFFDKVGMGQVFRDAVNNKRLYDITMVNAYRRRLDDAFAPIIKNKAKMRRFCELMIEYRKKGMSVFEGTEFKEIAKTVKRIFDHIARLSVEHEVEVFNPVTDKNEPFAQHIDPHYQPNIYHPKKIAKMRKTDKLFQRVQEMTGIEDKRLIDRIVDSILANRKGYRQGNLENVRIFDEPGWLGDPRDPNWKPRDLIDGYMIYIHQAIDRISSLHFFEGKGENGIDLYGKYINKMSEPNRKIAMEYMNRIRGLNRKGHFDDWAATIRSLQLMRKLNLSPIANSFQTLITTLPKYSMLGYQRMIIDLAKEAWPIIKTMKHNDLASLGIDMSNAMESLIGLQGGNNLNNIARKWLKANTFAATEFFNRNFSYHLGRRYVTRMINILHGKEKLSSSEYTNWIQGDGRKIIISELKKMGISDRAIDTGIIGPREWHRAGYRFAMETQFGTMPENLPFAWSTPWGKVATQFKSFTFSNARFVKDNIIKPILKNPTSMSSWKPLLTWLAAANIAGETATYIRQQALKYIFGIERKKPRSTDPVIRGIENMLAISPFGLGWELWQSLGYGDFWTNILGPTAGDIEDIMKSIRNGELPVEKVMPYPLDKAVKILKE